MLIFFFIGLAEERRDIDQQCQILLPSGRPGLIFFFLNPMKSNLVSLEANSKLYNLIIHEKFPIPMF
jgi:hypothetical protein